MKQSWSTSDKSKESSVGIFREKGKLLTCILSGTPVLSMRLATFTVLPQMSYWGLRAPITPATTGPMLRPTAAHTKSNK